MTTTYSSALSPEYALLGFLAQQPAHGYQLHQRLVTELGQVWHVSLSQTYNILKRIEAQGLIAGETQQQDKLPPRLKYHLTNAGRERLEKWLLTPTGSSVRAIRVEFITRLYFAALLGPDVPARLIQGQKDVTQSALDRLEASLAQLHGNQTFNYLGLDLRVRQLRAALDWLIEVEATLVVR